MCESVPLRQCLVMSVVHGESCHLPASLFGPELVKQVVVGVTGECPEKIFHSSSSDILLVYGPSVDLNKVRVQLEYLASWLGKSVKLKCVRPSGVQLKKFEVVGAVPSLTSSQGGESQLGDVALELPFFSGKDPPDHEEVAFEHWLSMVEVARNTSSPQALHGWIQRSVKEPAASLLRSLGVGVSLDKILSSFKLAYGNVQSFDELMKEFLNVHQFSAESVTDYVVRLEKAFAILRKNYPNELSMVDKTHHLRERFYRGLKKEIHQRLTPSYEDQKTPYVILLKRARQLEEELGPSKLIEARGARDDPQMRNVIQSLKEIREQMEQLENPPPHPQKRWKGAQDCYYCGEAGHWRKRCPQRPVRKRKAPTPVGGGEKTPVKR